MYQQKLEKENTWLKAERRAFGYAAQLDERSAKATTPH
jgi:hypothetical protein